MISGSAVGFLKFVDKILRQAERRDRKSVSFVEFLKFTDKILRREISLRKISAAIYKRGYANAQNPQSKISTG
ncbi:hypothetical protein [uncultured Campylobacter sp.]|uniref:hypothetical protein n=1 Tax=uncultured Campylobacter sp. TaxID=218934 RepID=UPI00263268C8|nr:hypothetical protein [uncultured Campylobacter sp.]